MPLIHPKKRFSFLFPDRSYMRLTEKENETLPIDIVLQTLLSFVFTCYGIVHISGGFKDMDASSELKNKTFDTLRNHPSFYLFNHRGRVLFSPPEQEPSTPSAQASPSNPLRLRKLENYHWDWPSVGCMVRFHFFLSYIYLLAPRLKGKISIFSCLVVYVNILYKHASLVVTILSMDCANSFSSWYVCKYLLLLGSLKSAGYGCSPPLGCRSQGTNPTCTMSVCHVFGWTDPNCNRFFPVPVWIEVNVVDHK